VAKFSIDRDGKRIQVLPADAPGRNPGPMNSGMASTIAAESKQRLIEMFEEF